MLAFLAFASVIGGSSQRDPTAPPDDSGCGSKCTQFMIGLPLVSISVGALLGTLTGSKHFFPLDLGPASSP